MASRSLNDNRGFTLIEVLIAAAVLAMSAAAVVSVFVTVKTLNRRARNITLATQAAQQEIEVLRNTAYASLPIGSTDFSSSLPGELQDPKTATAVIAESPVGLKRVDITISYGESGRSKQIQFSTAISQIGIDR
ncbi:MAG TPA: prepilin-type N-terminal cleavage/methylation domain-containing protein [Candidatus Nanoarchaeia archaeon]|nr:prepilin-type N-terminal cleavage/methylation domain-containing protein [Candidatus Nanoarchaeia archaeon]